MTENIHPEQQAAEDAATARAAEEKRQSDLAAGRAHYRASIAAAIATQVAAVREQTASAAPDDADRVQRASQADVLEAVAMQTATASLVAVNIALKLDALLELVVGLAPKDKQATVRENTRAVFAIVDEETQKVAPEDMYG
jgi:hypothetical protein